MPSLFESARPTTFDHVVGQDEAVAAIRTTIARGWGGRAWWITGASGTGKTTCGKLIAREGASELSTDEHDAGSLTPAKLREIEHGYRCRPLPIDGKAGYAILVNECHRMRRDTVAALLDVLERLPGHVCWVFTTTIQGQTSLFEDDRDGDCAPLVSRCMVIELESGPEVNRALALRAKSVAQTAGIDGLPDETYIAALESCRGNLRALLQRVESGQLARAARQECQRYLSQPLAQQDARKRASYQKQLEALDSGKERS